MEFKNFRLRFLVDGKEVAMIPFRYGESLSNEVLPEITPKTDFLQNGLIMITAI